MPARPALDLIIRSPAVYDGASPGNAGIAADIGIKGDLIVVVGDLSAERAAKEYDASGLAAAPGFIDIHTHSDISLGYNPEQASSISMGVTTQVVGNCGLSIGFATDSPAFSFEKRWIAPHGGKITWSSFKDYLDQVDAQAAGNNIVPLAGHGTLRKLVMGGDDRAPSAGEMAAMKRELAMALGCGAWGLSSGLEYPPSSFATEAELVELCKVVADNSGIYATHLRNEGDTLIESVQEALNVARAAQAPLQLSHHKAEGPSNWGKVHRTLDMVDAARAAGLDVQMDQYPYTAFMTSLAIQTLPRHVLAHSQDEISSMLRDPQIRETTRAEMLAAHPQWNDQSENSPWALIRIGVCRNRPELQGHTIAALAAGSGIHPVDLVLDLYSDPNAYISAINFAICEDDIGVVMRYPWTSIGSDGSGANPNSAAAGDMIHPRTYGTFTRVLGRYVREQGLFGLGEAIYRMTGLPAARMGLQNRGRIAPGCHADITLFNPQTVVDRATFDAPHQTSAGIDSVLVNGVFALKRGAITGELAGRLLRHGR